MKDNTEKDNTEKDNTEKDNTEKDNTGKENTGKDNTKTEYGKTPHGKEGILYIRGLRRDAGDEEINESRTTARYLRKDGKGYLFYRETMEDGSQNQVRMTIGENEVLLRKKGSGSSSFHFHRGKEGNCRYQTPMGVMEMTSHTRVIRRKESNHEFRLKLEYTLYMAGKALSEYELDIHFRG